jgi:hypothetical protein
MSKIFNTTAGELNICGGVTLRAGMSMEAVEALGIIFTTDLRTSTGWTRRSTAPRACESHLLYCTLQFHSNRLVKVAFSFVENPLLGPHELQELYRLFLQRELGEPTTTLHDGQTVSYCYPWGKVEATYDPRNGSSAIHFSWPE